MKRQSTPSTALYVRLPATEALKLDRAAEALGAPKKDLVTDLVVRYVDPDTAEGLDRLRALRTGVSAPPLRAVATAGDEGEPAVGRHSFRAVEAAEVLTAAQAAVLLQVDEIALLDLAQEGRLPGRCIAGEWRFARTAVLAWLSETSTTPE